MILYISTADLSSSSWFSGGQISFLRGHNVSMFWCLKSGAREAPISRILVALKGGMRSLEQMLLMAVEGSRNRPS